MQPESYIPLGNLKIHTDGWKIDFSKILTPKRDVTPYIYLIDKFFEAPGQKHACLIYTTVEWGMMRYSGLIAIFENKQDPKIIINPINQWFVYLGYKTFYFLNDILFLRKEAYNKIELLSGTPFIAIDLKDKKFGFIDFDFSSIYYSLIHIKDSLYRFILDSPEEIIRLKVNNHDGKMFDISAIKFYDFNKFDMMLELYKNEKIEMNKSLH